MKKSNHTAFITCQDETYQLTECENAMLKVDFTFYPGKFSIDSDGLDDSDPDDIGINNVELVSKNGDTMPIEIKHSMFMNMYGYLLFECAHAQAPYVGYDD